MSHKTEYIWTCKIGGPAIQFQSGADLPMRQAVQTAFKQVTGNDEAFCFSGWGGELTEPERAVVENRLPSAEYEAEWNCRAAVEAAQPEAAKLDDIEQYRMQMAGISTAAFGYWTEGDGIHPDYDTVPLRDVAKLYAKYNALFRAVRDMPAIRGAVARGWCSPENERKEMDSVLALAIAAEVSKLLSAAPTPTESQPAEADERSEREAFEAWAISILGDNPTWKESAPYELAWQSWQARALSAPTAPAQAEPYAYAVYFPKEHREELVHDLDELLEDLTNEEHTVTPLHATPPTAASDATPPATAAGPSDAERYRLVRRGQHWSVIDGIGNVLRGDDLDAAIDAAIRANKGGKL